MLRRQFMKRGLLGGAVLLLGGATGLALRGGATIAPLRPLQSIEPRAFPILVAVAARVLDGTDADPIAVAHGVDIALMRTNDEGRRDFSRVLMLFENALPGLLLRGSVTPFTAMTPEQQDRALIAWRDSPLALLRGAYHALRKLSLGAFYATPASWKWSGYAGPFIGKPEVPFDPRGPLSPPFAPEGSTP